MFSFVSIPFSLKIFWAPIVDSIYFPSIGRRKSWILPIQLLCGFILIYSAHNLNEWLGTTSSHATNDNRDNNNKIASNANVFALTCYFTFQFFLMATQDVAVDGWALTLLSPKNVGYATLCNNIGQSLGSYLAFNGLLSLTDPLWCERHSYLLYNYQGPGTTVLTFESFVTWNGYLFIISTILIIIFQKEKAEKLLPSTPTSSSSSSSTAIQSIIHTFKEGLLLFSLPCIQMLTMIIFTRKLGCAVMDAALGLKLQEGGMPKADLICFATISLILSLVLPTFVHITRPLDVWTQVYKYKLLFDIGKYAYLKLYICMLYLCIYLYSFYFLLLLCYIYISTSTSEYLP